MPILSNAKKERFAQELAKGKSATEAAQIAEYEIVLCGSPTGFYVYALIDPRTDKPFYIGKGKNKRYCQHVRNVRAGREKNIAKSCAIRSILANGLQVTAICVADGLSEHEAFDLEDRIIHMIGAKNLTNFAGGMPRWRRNCISALMNYQKIMPLKKWIILEYLHTKKLPDEWRISMFKRVRAEFLALAARTFNYGNPDKPPLKVCVPAAFLSNGDALIGYIVS